MFRPTGSHPQVPQSGPGAERRSFDKAAAHAYTVIMKNVRSLVKRTFGILLAVLFLASGCTLRQSADQTAESFAAQTAALDVFDGIEYIQQAASPASTASPTPDPTPTAEPTPVPTPTAVPTPAPVSDEELQNGALDSFFNDSVLIGDSMTAGFSHYILAQRDEGACLGNMKCIGQSGLLLKHAYRMEVGTLSPGLHYRGHNYSISDLVRELGVKTLYLMLGVRDWYTYNSSIEDVILHFDEIIRNTREKSPDVQIVLITIPPVLKNYARLHSCDPHYNIDVNEALHRYCEENRFGFVELAALLRGEDGYLKLTYCCDKSFHLNYDGDALWLAALREYARTQYEAGAWTPEETGD